ncbi:penicillin-binding protein 1A [Sandaracinobacteroides saxicola]|uniref:Penicillin-binding protein 1A n=1 Tax=Sandaracinobacteroides saxicola TaxID=2759707 RepID=A0A7G5IHH2_9SPHN|nr:PBP1A family penicillin-binding protein [Sandaracinobacteroides saxicola]QMW22814.1 PBP1A family penicillin-binding protein [Sandaracinobacteroides saxicola]
MSASSSPFVARVASRWAALSPRQRRWGRIGAFVAGLLAVALVFFWYLIGRGLPDASTLANYQAPLPTNVRAVDGTPFRSFARERRVFLPYGETPPLLIQAFLSAEDKTFFQHSGLDWFGIAQAVVTNIESMASDKRPVGASTITQQVAKNLLLTNEVTLGRKLREAILARRIEQQFSKGQILELYLNEIFLGRNAYGVEAAAQAYFGKPARELDVAEAAFLAILPKAPSNYNPTTNYDRALTRRNWVLGQMADNGWITAAERDAARATPITTIRQAVRVIDRNGDYFMEELRRQLMARFGESAADGPNSVYAGGLWVRATIDPVMQKAAEKALRDGLVRYDRAKGWRGPAARIDPGEGWQGRLAALRLGVGYPEWRAAMVLARGDAITLGFTDGSTGRMALGDAAMPRAGVGRPAWQLLKAGDVVPVARSGGGAFAGWSLRQIPAVSGAMVVQDPHSGRVLAMVGGFDMRGSAFNRATQAQRQPGSSFKPFVYAAALDNGMTPASIILDAPYCVFQTRQLGEKCFRNFTGGYAGPQTMRWGLEQSRNLMTVRVAYNTGMDKVVALAKDLGIGNYQPVLAISLGAGETTPMRLVNAYSTLVNGGRQVTPILFDLVQDRQGKAIFRADARACADCNRPGYTGQPMPQPADTARQVMDARTAYQVVHMLEGVVERGTAVTLRDLGYPIAGKTGTTSGPTDVWFVGGTPDLVAGLYIGYDRPRNLGGWIQGGTFAAPVWKQWAQLALKDPDKTPFLAPAGVRMVRIDRRSGKRVFGVWPGFGEARPAVIWEAFKPESEPRRLTRANTALTGRVGVVRSDADFLKSTGGIY